MTLFNMSTMNEEKKVKVFFCLLDLSMQNIFEEICHVSLHDLKHTNISLHEYFRQSPEARGPIKDINLFYIFFADIHRNFSYKNFS